MLVSGRSSSPVLPGVRARIGLRLDYGGAHRVTSPLVPCPPVDRAKCGAAQPGPAHRTAPPHPLLNATATATSHADGTKCAIEVELASSAQPRQVLEGVIDCFSTTPCSLAGRRTGSIRQRQIGAGTWTRVSNAALSTGP